MKHMDFIGETGWINQSYDHFVTGVGSVCNLLGTISLFTAVPRHYSN